MFTRSTLTAITACYLLTSMAASVQSAKIQGYVKDAAGNPISGALVAIDLHPNPLSDNDFGYSTTNAAGYYEMPNFEPGTYYIAAWAYGWHASADATAVIETPTDTKTVGFTLKQESVNLALSAVASTNNPDPNNPGAGPQYANDGNFGTRFYACNASYSCSIDNIPTQLLLDLGANCKACEMLIYWEWSWAREYKIQCLPDGFNPDVASTDWITNGTLLYSTAAGNPYGSLSGFNWWTGIDVIRFPAQNARYWRIYAARAANTWTMSVWEVELYDQADSADSIGRVKTYPDGTQVELLSKRVTAVAGAGLPANAAYIEEQDRSSGIRIDTAQAAGSAAGCGDTVDVIGVMATTADGERYVSVSTIGKRADTTSLEPLGMAGRSANDSLSEGLFVKLWGKVSNVGANSFTLSDGSEPPIEVYCGSLIKPAEGEYIKVRGVLSREAGQRTLLMRDEQVDWAGIDAFQPLPFGGVRKAFREYLLLGPFVDSFGDGEEGRNARLAFDYISNASWGALTEETVRPSTGDTIGGKQWTRSDGTEELLSLDRALGPAENSTTYAHIYVWSPINQFVDLKMGSDDSVKVWVNGNWVWMSSTWSSLYYDRDTVMIPLNSGLNSILFKIVNGPGTYGLTARLTNVDTADPVQGLGYCLNRLP